MHAPSFSRPARLIAVIMLAACALTAPAETPVPPGVGSGIVVAQAEVPPASPPAMDHAPAAPASKSEIPEVLPGINKKRVAFWGVTFMGVTSLIFVLFGIYAIRKTPKPGQQRPDSYEKK